MAIAITNAAQLAQIGVSPDYPGNGSYILQNDIQIPLGWVPLPNADGIDFDGNRHRIFTLTNALFAGISNGAVRNLTLDLNINIPSVELPNDGAAAGLTLNASDSAFTNVMTTGHVAGIGMTGGLAASSRLCAFTGCTNYAAVTSQDDLAGGIAGQSKTCNFISCTNYGSISAPGSSFWSWAGGIVALYDTIYPTEAPETVPVQITNCVNYGSIEASLNGGGIVGWGGGWAFEIRGCKNHGPVFPSPYGLVSPTGDLHYGGTAGWLILLSPYRASIDGCVNNASVSGGGFIGGIVGLAQRYYHEGNDYTWNSTFTAVAGRMGTPPSAAASPSLDTDFTSLTLARSQNTGSVTLSAHGVGYPYGNAGGIAGAFNFAATTTDCLNTGAVSSNTWNTGGIAGWAASVIIEDCVNQGTVTGNDRTGGIAGVAEQVWYYAEFPIPMELNKCILRSNTNAPTAAIHATGFDTGGITGLIATGTHVLDNKSCAEVHGGDVIGGVVGESVVSFPNRITVIPAFDLSQVFNVITGNLVSSPSITGGFSVFRVLGYDYADIDILRAHLFNTQIFPNVLLTGESGLIIYNNQPVSANDPQLGAELLQGETLVCPPGQTLKSCVGCVPEVIPPCPCPPCPCLPRPCRPPCPCPPKLRSFCPQCRNIRSAKNYK